MTPDQVRTLFDGIKRGHSRGRRAPHKPLLLLYALARFAEGEEHIAYEQLEEQVKRLLRDFGPRDGPYNVHYPFWRLQNDGVWEVENAERVEVNASGDPVVSVLRQVNPVGHFPDDIAAALRANPALIRELIERLLTQEFTDAYDEEVLTAIGFDPEPPTEEPRKPRRRRDPAFRARVLTAYERRCAVCGFNAFVGDALVGVDAAHIRWHQYGGPDEVSNGLALCALHHRLFDRGAFTITSASARERIVTVAEDAHGGEGFARWLKDFHGRPIAEPVSTGYRVAEPFTAWHRREVFRGPARS